VPVAARNWRRRRSSVKDYIWTGAVVVLLLIYLIYALLKPHKF
jgi:K+-transporting ATPase KdpF subunit